MFKQFTMRIQLLLFIFFILWIWYLQLYKLGCVRLVDLAHHPNCILGLRCSYRCSCHQIKEQKKKKLIWTSSTLAWCGCSLINKSSRVSYEQPLIPAAYVSATNILTTSILTTSLWIVAYYLSIMIILNYFTLIINQIIIIKKECLLYILFFYIYNFSSETNKKALIC